MSRDGLPEHAVMVLGGVRARSDCGAAGGCPVHPAAAAADDFDNDYARRNQL